MSQSNSTMTSDSEISLADNIVGRYVVSKVNTERKQEYLPEGAIEKLITLRSVEEELSYDLEPSPDLVEFFATRARRIFALAILSMFEGSTLYTALEVFQEEEFTDDKLPIFEDRDAELITRIFRTPPGLRRKKLWSKVQKQRFLEDQWKFLAPVFTQQELKHTLSESHILPLKRVSDTSKSGTFGEVYEAIIHRSHLDNALFQRNGSRTNVAVKEIKTSQLPADDVQKAYNIEASALSKSRKVEHDNLIPCLAAIEQGSMHYFLFPWADAGSLQDLWEKNSVSKLSQTFVMDVLEQLHGLSAALEKLHNYDDTDPSASDSPSRNGGGIRHGDLKPGNILIFKSEDPKRIGTLKIADMGLAKYHQVQTQLRKNMSSTRYGTCRYEPPEVGVPKLTSSATSRLYDTWSMGCIFLEFLIWLMYGSENLVEFNQSIHDHNTKIQWGSMYNLEPPYYIVGSDKKAEVHPLVVDRLNELSRHPQCRPNTALGDLFRVIRTELLVVELPTHHYEQPSGGRVSVTPSPTQPCPGPHRATAQILRESMDKILDRARKDRNYLLADQERRVGPRPSLISKPSSSGLHPDAAYAIGKQIKPSARVGTQMRGNPSYTHRNLNIKVWDYPLDNNFASKVLEASPGISTTPSADLCAKCQGLDLWATELHINDRLSDLEERQTHCQFCRMRWEVSKHLPSKSIPISFDRVGSIIKLNESDPPVFSIRCSPGARSSSVQVGTPKISRAARTEFQVNLINTWLRECDDKHAKCKGISDLELLPTTPLFRRRKTFRLPTRLIDLGDTEFGIRLYETQPADDMQKLKYVALSHQWGDPNASNHFRTTVTNRDAHLTKIDFEKLPTTFKDAVTTTRDMGIRYLWIDSICIIQGPGGDFNTESQRMEDVFSSAYCVIAASSATDQWDGFLKDRTESSRQYATFEREGSPPIYICHFLDDFNHDVLDGPLNKRGWVLQERVLARRTIYFTDKQIYWECGDGVRCETLTHMKNELAAFLGDPNFPEVAIHSQRADRETSRGEKILYYQDLYKTYSKLAFSKWEDRGVAMNGLEQRLSRGFKCRGQFGILDDSDASDHRSLLHRSLLWHRASSETSLRSIPFPADRQQVPSWSWMAYQGEIDYLSVPFDGVDWEASLQSPWHSSDDSYDEQTRGLALRATGCELVHFSDRDLTELCDRPEEFDETTSDLLCVVIGRAKGVVRNEDKMHYILLIRPIESLEPNLYERIGAGRVPGSWIDFVNPTVGVRIC
ncbi:hypothetical protein NM208_g1319 [Fusarium decemcellulare]|uniref:Uncharacterized protein n=1 Tax=Fusarium decemcellulare TaxID=57161 RepID=A0ACC1SWF4_9HYPO|nr:hypothetical protein NM208_g1319 [Fusarium decemcellulare]